MRNIYDLTFIGSGPSTIFAILKLIEKGYNKNICIIIMFMNHSNKINNIITMIILNILLDIIQMIC